MGTFHKVAEAKGLAPGKGMAIEVAGNKIALFNVDGTCYAIADACTHRWRPTVRGITRGQHGDLSVARSRLRCLHWRESDTARASGSDILQRARRGGRRRSRDILGNHG